MIAVSNGSKEIKFDHIQEALDRIQMGSKQALGDNKQAIRNTMFLLIQFFIPLESTSVATLWFLFLRTELCQLAKSLLFHAEM